MTTTFSEDNYLNITFFSDGTYEVDEPFDYNKYADSLTEQIDMMKALNNENDPEITESIESLEKLRNILKAIWDDDDEFIDNFEDDEYEIQ